MTVLIALGVSILAGYKTIPETQVREPYEWVGELFGALIAALVGLAAGVALYLALGDLNPLNDGPRMFDPPTRLTDVPRYFHWRF